MKLPALAFALVLCATPLLAIEQPSIQVYFSPTGGCTEAVVDALGAAKKSVFIHAYSFTSPRLRRH